MERLPGRGALMMWALLAVALLLAVLAATHGER